MDTINLGGDFFEFIKRHANSDVGEVALHQSKDKLDFPLDFALLQIKCRQKCRIKLMSFLKNDKFLFPDSVSSEQASHEAIAKYHASILNGQNHGLDMTAGLGIDSLTISRHVLSLVACERDEIKASILKHNLNVSDISNVDIYNGDSTVYLHNSDIHYDFIFVDPARRDKQNSRLYNIHDCIPDITELLPEMLLKSNLILVKTSPLLDIVQTIRDIPELNAIHVVSVDNECKEILVEIRSECMSHPNISAHAIDLDATGNVKSDFSFYISKESFHEESEDSINFAELKDIEKGRFLYEPATAVMKLAPWNSLSQKYNDIKKLGSSSHLFVSDILYDDFPGRISRIVSLPEKKDRKTMKGLPINIVTRNYPVPAQELRKKLSVKEGKDLFLYATRLGTKPIMILSERVRI